MSDSPITLREVFEVPKAGVTTQPTEGWEKFQGNILKELKSVKIAAMPDLMAKVGELLDVPIPNILLASWKKADALQSALAESRKAPEAEIDLALCEHSVKSKHTPCIEVIVQNATIKKIDFTMLLVFRLKGFILTVQNGAIKHIQTGTCEVAGTIEYEGLEIANKKLTSIKLPDSLAISEPAH
jgi:hypothetical protein